MPLTAPSRSSLVDQVIAQLHGSIETGEWPVGSKIPAEAELVDKLGVGRNTVREAIRALVHGGMLEPRQGDGTYVLASSDLGAVLLRRLERSNPVEALEVRNSLERDAARMAATRHSDEDLRRIQDALSAQIETMKTDDMEAIVDADVVFHFAIVTATHNSVLIDLYDYLTEALRESIMAAITAHDRNGVRIEEHIAITEAIAARDPEGAERAAITHLSHSIAAVEAFHAARTAGQVA